jgi:hypothetical protein
MKMMSTDDGEHAIVFRRTFNGESHSGEALIFTFLLFKAFIIETTRIISYSNEFENR